MGAQRWLAFAGASLLVAILPGPGVANVVGIALQAGLATARTAILGAVAGNVLAMTIGLSGYGTILVAIPRMARALTWLGAFYLVLLGADALLRAASHPMPRQLTGAMQTRRAAFAGSLVVSAFNPKPILFFLAFVPQFIATDRSFAAQSLVLIATFAAIVALSDSVYAYAAVRVTALLDKPASRARVRCVAGLVLISTGLAAAYAASAR